MDYVTFKLREPAVVTDSQSGIWFHSHIATCKPYFVNKTRFHSRKK